MVGELSPSQLAALTLRLLPPHRRLEAARNLEVPRERSHHTLATWARALEAYAEAGLTEAAASSGVPRRTLARWARQSGVFPGRPSRLRVAEAERYEELQRGRPSNSDATPEEREAWMQSVVGRPPAERSWCERSRHSVSTRENALRLYSEVGPREAARRSGVPLRTLARWASSAGTVAPSESVARTQPATKARRENVKRNFRARIYAMNGLTDKQIEEAEARLAQPRITPPRYRSLADARDQMTRARESLGDG